MSHKKQTDCAIVKDLLPLYRDDVLCEETKSFVTEHLRQCEDCRQEYDQMCEDMFPEWERSAEGNTKQLFDRTVRKAKRRRNMFIVIMAVILWILTCGVGNYLLEHNTVSVLDSEAHIYEACAYPHDGVTTYYVFYTVPGYVPSEYEPRFEENDGKIKVHFNIRRSLLARDTGSRAGEMWSFDISGEKPVSAIECADAAIDVEVISQVPGYIACMDDPSDRDSCTLLPEYGVAVVDTGDQKQVWSLRGERLIEKIE